MPARHISTVTQNGMTTSQPGTSVSMTTFNGVSILHVTRHYNLVNTWGGIGRIHRLDCDDIEFADSNAANEFALDHGYLQKWFARGYPNNALRAAFDTLKRGEYHGKRKLTQHLVRRAAEMKTAGTWVMNMHNYNMKWNNLC